MSAKPVFQAVVPARFASTRLPGKPLADIAGKPMVVRVLERASESGAAGVWAATDHPEVYAAVQAAGFQAVMTSPDCASGTDRLAEVAAHQGWPDDVVVINVQGDEPLIDPDLIRATAQALFDHPAASMATVSHPIHDPAEIFNPNVVKVVTDKAGYALYFSRAPIPWARDAWAGDPASAPLPPDLPVFRHIGLYAYRVGFLKAYPGLERPALEHMESLEQLRAPLHGPAHRGGQHRGGNSPGGGHPGRPGQGQAAVRQSLTRSPALSPPTAQMRIPGGPTATGSSRSGSLRRVIQTDPRRVLAHTLLWGGFLALLLALPFTLYYRSELQSAREQQQREGEEIIRLASENLRLELDSALSDLRFLAGMNKMRALLEVDSPTRRRELAGEFLEMTRQKKRYDQIRFIGLDGREAVRVNGNYGTPSVVDDGALQFKGDRPYFQATLALRPGEVHVSLFELNIEHGRLEEPYKPVLRLAMPLAGAQGRVRGILVINLLGQRLLDRLAGMGTKPGGLWLVDGRGYWLLGPTPTDAWGFAAPGRAERSLSRQYPDLWRRISSEDHGLWLAEEPRVVFQRIAPFDAAVRLDTNLPPPPRTGLDFPWILLARLPTEGSPENGVPLAGKVAALYGLWALFGFGLAGALSFMGQRQAALARIAERVIDGLPMLVAYVDSGLRYRFNNLAYVEVFGLTPRQLFGKRMDEILDPDTYRELEPLMAQALAGHAVARELGPARNRERWRDVQVSYVPDRRDDGRVEGIFVMVHDITERKDAERRERQHMHELAHVARLASLGEMAGEIAHEVNQPLSAIAMYSSACLRRTPTGDEQLRNWLEAINAQAKRAGDVVRRLRSFVGKGELRPGPVDLNQVVRDVVGLMRFEADRLGVSLVVAPESDPVLLSAEHILVEQVLFNLVRNALEALSGQEGGAGTSGQVLIRTRQSETHAWVEVEDNGPGVDPTRGNDIFEPFMTDKQEGMGMGLAISRSIVVAHGGTLDYVDTPGRGATFRVCLPKEPKVNV